MSLWTRWRVVVVDRHSRQWQPDRGTTGETGWADVWGEGGRCGRVNDEDVWLETMITLVVSPRLTPKIDITKVWPTCGLVPIWGCGLDHDHVGDVSPLGEQLAPISLDHPPGQPGEAALANQKMKLWQGWSYKLDYNKYLLVSLVGFRKDLSRAVSIDVKEMGNQVFWRRKQNILTRWHSSKGSLVIQ